MAQKQTQQYTFKWSSTRVSRIYKGEKYSFQQVVLENWIFTCKIMKLDPYHIAYIKINSNWNKDQHVRPEPLTSLKKYRGKFFSIYFYY